MFPTPIEKTGFPTRLLYRLGLPLALLVWLLPIIAVAMTSIRGGADLSSGNYWGLPTEWRLVENYTAVFSKTPLAATSTLAADSALRPVKATLAPWRAKATTMSLPMPELPPVTNTLRPSRLG